MGCLGCHIDVLSLWHVCQKGLAHCSLFWACSFPGSSAVNGCLVTKAGNPFDVNFFSHDIWVQSLTTSYPVPKYILWILPFCLSCRNLCLCNSYWPCGISVAKHSFPATLSFLEPTPCLYNLTLKTHFCLVSYYKEVGEWKKIQSRSQTLNT